MPTIDIDRETAHEAAQRELAKPIYPKSLDPTGSTIGSTISSTG